MRDFGFFVAIAFGIGLSLLVATPIMKADIQAGDWLSFTGALLGVALAVFGALAVEREKERNTSKRIMRRLVAAIGKIEEAANFVAIMDVNGTPAAKAMELRGRALVLTSALSAIEYTMSRIDIEDLDIWSILNGLMSGLPELREMLKSCIDLDWGAMPEEKLTDQRAMVLQRYLAVIAPSLVKAKSIAIEKLR